jgi:hypothetical protein
VREEQKKGWGLLEGRFYITLKLEVEREYIIITCGLGEALLSQEGSSPRLSLT